MSASLGSAALLVAVLVSVCAGQTEVRVSPGGNATLPCRGSSGGSVTLLRWSKPDLQSQLYVFFFRDNSPVESFQHPSFKGRVQLTDPQVKSGDFSIILTSVSEGDVGGYECSVRYDKQEPQVLSSIALKVGEAGPTEGITEGRGKKEDGGEESGPLGLIVGLSVFAVLIVAAVVGFMIYRKNRKQSVTDYRPPADQSTEMCPAAS